MANWLQKISVLEPEWWKRIIYHLSQVVSHIFRKGSFTSWHEIKDQSEPTFIVDGVGTKNGFYYTFGQRNMKTSFFVLCNGHIYSCVVSLEFDRYIAKQLAFQISSPEEFSYQVLSNLKDLDAELTGVSVNVLRDYGSGQGRTLGPVDMLPQEANPYYIIETIKDLIINDRDDGESEPLYEPSEPPSIFSPSPVPSMVGT